MVRVYYIEVRNESERRDLEENMKPYAKYDATEHDVLTRSGYFPTVESVRQAMEFSVHDERIV